MSPRATGLGRVQEVALKQEQQGHLLDCSGRAVDAGDGVAMWIQGIRVLLLT
jgi:hypothetical protein